MKYKKKFALAMLTLLLLAKTSNIYAKNNSDTDWSVDTFGSAGYTPIRTKTDPSPVYLYTSNTNKEFTANVVNKDGSNPSFSQRVLISRPGKYCLSSYMYEDHRRNVGCKVKMVKSGYGFFSARGQWSPDSISCAW